MGKTPSVLKSDIKIALIGNPNAGKSSVFNRLTGLRQHVGNFPGVTVDRKTGTINMHAFGKAKVTDFPGTYSLYPTSEDERIVLNILSNPQHPDYPDVVVYVADITNLERHLLLLTQVADLGFPIVLALTMYDVGEQEGWDVDAEKLSDALGGIPVCRINGRTGKGVEELKAGIGRALSHHTKPFYDTLKVAPELIGDVRAQLHVENSYHALLLAHHYAELPHLNQAERDKLKHLTNSISFSSIKGQVNETMARYDRIGPLVKKALRKNTVSNKGFFGAGFTERLDNVLTHPFWGSFIFLSILFFTFQAIFAWASYPMDLIDGGIGSLNQWLQAQMPQGMLTDLLTEGVIAGLGGILVFVPQITILFLLVAILEESGYMSRAVFLSDSVMRRFGLNGRSIVSLISGVACAIPAIMATRTINNWKERLITIFVTPLMSCSARIPVFTVLVALTVPQEYYFGFLNLQGLATMGLYLLGTSAAIFSAWAMKKVLRTRDSGFFIIEMPDYKMPQWKNVAFVVYEKVKTFVVEAGRIILIISIILWFLASFGPGQQMEGAAEQVKAEHPELSPEEQDKLIAAKQIEVSYAGYLGKFIEPAIEPLGFNWQIGIALITSFAAREVFIGTISTIYSIGEDSSDDTIIENLKSWKSPETGELVFSAATAGSLLIFYVFAMQCMSTLAIVKRETNSWKWPMLQLLYMTALAYLASFVTFQLLS